MVGALSIREQLVIARGVVQRGIDCQRVLALVTSELLLTVNWLFLPRE